MQYGHEVSTTRLGPFETRFLILIGRQEDDDGTLSGFEIVTAFLTRPLKYCTLSHCWGDIKHTSTIEVDGEAIQVSQNLAEGLYHSGMKGSALLWVGRCHLYQANRPVWKVLPGQAHEPDLPQSREGRGLV
jgi:hypothetical protein